MFKIAPPGWLTDFLNGLRRGGYLQANAEQCDRLAYGFVGCNLVANLGDLVTGIGHSWPGSVFGGYGLASYAQLRLWLLAPPTSWSDLDALTGPAAVAAMQTGGFDPWWQINRWLGIEAYLRLLARRVAAPVPTVWDKALQTFEAIPASSGLAPQPCRLRGEGLLAAFQQWWDAVADGFHQRWQAQAWHDAPPVQRTAVCRDLAASLGQQTGHALRQLTLDKNQRLLFCIVQLNQAFSGPVPTPEGWLARFGGHVYAALTAGDDLELDRTDLKHLVDLGRWVGECGLDSLDLELNVALGGNLTNPPSALTVPGPLLRRLVSVLDKLLRRIPTRGLPRTIPLGPISDLFAYTVPNTSGLSIRFTPWADVMKTRYGLPEWSD